MSNRIAVYPGTFDPLTRGHEDLVRRAARLFERVVVGIAESRSKKPCFSLDERVGMAREALDGYANVEVIGFDGLLMTDDLSKIALGRAIALRAYRTIQENLIFGVGVVHVLGIIAALMGWIGPIQAAFLHLGPDLLVFLNSVKLLHVRINA